MTAGRVLGCVIPREHATQKKKHKPTLGSGRNPSPVASWVRSSAIVYRSKLYCLRVLFLFEPLNSDFQKQFFRRKPIELNTQKELYTVEAPVWIRMHGTCHVPCEHAAGSNFRTPKLQAWKFFGCNYPIGNDQPWMPDVAPFLFIQDVTFLVCCKDENRQICGLFICKFGERIANTSCGIC